MVVRPDVPLILVDSLTQARRCDHILRLNCLAQQRSRGVCDYSFSHDGLLVVDNDTGDTGQG